jgi:serine/threonine-protein kinase
VGKGPREPASARARRRGVDLPRAFDDWFTRATRLNPKNRFQSAREMIDALRAALLHDIAPSSEPLVSEEPDVPEKRVITGAQSAETKPGLERAYALENSRPLPLGGTVPIVTPLSGARADTPSIEAALPVQTASPQSITTGELQVGRNRPGRAPLFIVLAVLAGIAVGVAAFLRSTDAEPPTTREHVASGMSAGSDLSEPTISLSSPPAADASGAPSSLPSSATTEQPAASASSSTSTKLSPSFARPRPPAVRSAPPIVTGAPVWETR